MLFKAFSVAALVAAATAAPAAEAKPLKTFGVSFTAKGQHGTTTYNAKAVAIKKDVIVLVGENPKSFAGTPARFTGTPSSFDHTGDLVFEVPASKDKLIKGGCYNAIVPMVGDGHGTAQEIQLVKNMKDGGWGTYQDDDTHETMLVHKLFAAPDAFFACKQKINGKEETVLSFGVYNTDFTSPKGCVPADVKEIKLH